MNCIEWVRLYTISQKAILDAIKWYREGNLLTVIKKECGGIAQTNSVRSGLHKVYLLLTINHFIFLSYFNFLNSLSTLQYSVC